MDLKKLARKYALENAVEYDGECNPGAVIGKIMSEEDFEPGKVQKVAGQVCSEVNQMEIEEQKQEMEDFEYTEEQHEHDPLPDLQDTDEAGVVVRFAPNPNGAPHIGHARGMIINGELKQKYDGELILRFDDTDPRTKRPLKTEEYDAYQMLQEDYEWLGYELDQIIKSSERFESYIKYAEELNKMDKTYVCFCEQEKASELRSKGEACPHREQTIEVTQENWEKMKNGGISEGEAVLKIKTDLNHKNPAIRDFVAFRIIENADHPVTGDKYRVWPMLDFQGAIEDYELGTTHIVRGKDLRASTKRQKFIYNYFDWDYPNIRYWGNVQISGFNAPVSGSTLDKMIKDGELQGWDDARAPTIRALRKRGFQPKALKNFFIDMGVTENDIEASVETLESENRELVEKEANRYFFVKRPVEITVKGVPEELKAENPLHPDYKDRGTRNPEINIEDGQVKVLIEENDLKNGFLRLKGLCNIKIEGKTAEYVPGDHKVAVEKDADIIHWVPEETEQADIEMPDGKQIKGRIEPNQIESGDVIQFERFGFARCASSEQNKFYYAHN